MEYMQQSFAGGMNLAMSDARMGEDEYRYAQNVRSRFSVLEGVKTAKDVTNDIDSLDTDSMQLQAVITVGEFVFVFFDGGCVYRRPLNTSTWTVLMSGGTMNRSGPIYTQTVPASSMNYKRKTYVAGSVNTRGAGTGQTVNITTTTVAITVACIIVQDGTHQPRIIEINGNTVSPDRPAKKYTEWATPREYVPVGKQMCFFNNKLFIANGRKLYHSVSGRPLDFVVAVDEDGDAAGDADTVSYSVGYNEITSLAILNSEAIMVGTVGSSWGIKLVYSAEFNLFGEPFFVKQFLFTANPVNDFCFVDVLGDFAFVDPEGLRSFNAVSQSKNEGRNSVFSLKVGKLLQGVRQDVDNCAAITFDDYALFACKTTKGYGVIVYDLLTKAFVSFDRIVDDSGSIAGPIKMFAKVITNKTHELFAITGNHKLVKLYEGQKFADAYVETRSFCTQHPGVEQKPVDLKLLFNNVSEINGYNNIIVDGNQNGTGQGDVTVDPLTVALKSGSVIVFQGGGTITLSADAAVGATTITGIRTKPIGVPTNNFVDNATSVSIFYSKVKVIQRVNDELTPVAGVQTKTLSAPSQSIQYPVTYPVLWSGPNKLQNIYYNFQGSSQQGWKFNYIIEWSGGVPLSLLRATTMDITTKHPLLAQAYIT